MTEGTITAVPPSGEHIADRVQRALGERAFRIVFQPIVDLDDERTVAVEALSRFTAEPPGPPDAWFADAWRVGLGAELELAALEAALADVDQFPEGWRVAVNLSPSVITHPDLLGHVAAAGPARVVIELTEHVAVDDYDRVRAALGSLRAGGAKLAVDDMGAGFASFRHIVKLAPDIIKLDRELVHGIDRDPVRRSVAAAMVTFARDVGSDIVAEGIEHRRELDVVRALGIRYGQGMLLGAPEAARALVTTIGSGPPSWSRRPLRPLRSRGSLRTSGPARPEGPSPLRRPTPARATRTEAPTPPAGAGDASSRTAVTDGQVAAAAETLARLARAAVGGHVDVEPAEVPVLDRAATTLARLAAGRGGELGVAAVLGEATWA